MDKEVLIYMLRAAGRFMEGDFPSGKDTLDEQTREEARRELSSLRADTINSAILMEDEVSEALARHRNAAFMAEIAQLSLGEIKTILLGAAGAEWAKKYRDGLSSEAISALSKVMTDEELGIVSRKIFNSLPGHGGVTIGSRDHFGSRIQPNSAGDKEEEILFFILEALSYGCGDVMIGLNPACDDVETVVRLEDFLAGTVKRLNLPTRWCVLSDMVKQTRARERGAKVDLGFQSLAGTSSALKGVVGLGVKDILELSGGFPGLYFEIGMGLEVTNGADVGVDMRTLTSRAAGLIRYIQRTTGKWTVGNTVTNFIGPEVFRTESQLYRAALEDVFMLKMHGITGGIDVCAPFHMRIHPDRLRAVAEKIVEMVRPAFIMSVANNGIDPMLGYMSTPPRAYPSIWVQKEYRQPASAMLKRQRELGILGPCGLPKATPDAVRGLFAAYQQAGGDVRSPEILRMEAGRKISGLQAQEFDVGYGCPFKFVTPPVIQKRTDLIYRHAEEALSAKLEPTVLGRVSPQCFQVSTLSLDREDYINHPKTGNELCLRDRMSILSCYTARRPKVLFVFSGGLNANALNEQLSLIVPEVRRGLTEAGVYVGAVDVAVTNGRVRAGYHVGALLEVPLVAHFIGERYGMGYNTLSAYVTYGLDKDGSFRWSPDMDHSLTNAVCGIHPKGKHPSTAAKEIVRLICTIFERRCSGVELYAEVQPKSIILP